MQLEPHGTVIAINFLLSSYILSLSFFGLQEEPIRVAVHTWSPVRSYESINIPPFLGTVDIPHTFQN